MAGKREIKKKIKNEYLRLEDDIKHHMQIDKSDDNSKAEELLSTITEARKKFVHELNHAEKITGEYVQDLLKRVVDDVDKNYKALKKLISK